MKWEIQAKQSTGERSYIISEWQFEKTLKRPITPQEAEKFIETSQAPLIQFLVRVSGYYYLNSFLKEGSIGAEIGVDWGDGALRLLETNPKTLYLVDPYLPSGDRDPWTGVAQSVMDERCARAQEIVNANRAAVLLRIKSDDFFASLNDGELDWVYIDGDHYTAQVLRDLENSLRCVKVGGIISGDDLWCGRWHAEVGAALNKFLDAHPEEVEVIYDRGDPFILRRVK